MIFRGKGLNMTNKAIRMKLVEYDLKQWQLSKLLGKSEATVYRLLREELPEEEQSKIISLIEQSGGDSDEK